MIRIQGVIAAVLITVLTVLFGVFLLNPLVKSALIAGGEAVFKAKVEISSVKIDVVKSKAEIKGIAVADKNNEYRNLFEAEEITADIQVSKLLLRKVIVDKLAVLNLAAGTERKTPGFLPPAKLKKLAKKSGEKEGFLDGLETKIGDKAKSEISKMPVMKLGDMAAKLKDKDLKQLIKKEDLESYKKIREVEAGIKAEKEKTAAAINAVNTDAKIKSAKESVEAVKDIKVTGAQDIPAAKKALEELGKVKSSLDAAAAEIKTARAAAENFAAYSGNALKEIEKAKDADVVNVMKGMDINLLTAGPLERALIGPVWYDRVQKALEIAVLARKFMPPAKKKNKGLIIERKKGAGREILFIGELPDLWIKDIRLSTKGSTEKYVFSGFIKNLTTEQAAIDKPLTFAVSAGKNGAIFSAEGKIDHLKGINDSYAVSGKNLPPEITGLKDTDYGSVNMKSAYLDTEAKVLSTDDNLSLSGFAVLKKMAFDGSDKEDITYRVLSGISSLRINFEVKSSNAGSDINVSSDAFDSIKSSLEKIYGAKITEAKAKARKEIDAAIKDESGKLASKITADNTRLKSLIGGNEGKLKGASGEIDKAMADINGKISGSAASGAGNMLKGLLGK